MNVHGEERTIFPALLSDFERKLLNMLSTESVREEGGVWEGNQVEVGHH